MARTKKPEPKPKQPPPQGKPTLIFTKDGRPIGKVEGPPGANDIRFIWGVGLLGGGGYWTKDGKRMPGSEFVFPPGTNDWHFSVTGKFNDPAKLIPPPGANDIELHWKDGRIVEAWWTRDGERFSRIPLSSGTGEIWFAAGGHREELPEGEEEFAPFRDALAGIDLRSVGRDYAQIARLIERDASDWEDADPKDAHAAAMAGLDLVYAQAEMWRVGNDLRVAQAKALASRFPGAEDIALAAFYRPHAGRPIVLAGVPFYTWADKIEALSSILEELTGIPASLLKEYLAGELIELGKLLQEALEARKKHGKNSKEYKELVKRLERQLERILRILLSKKFFNWLKGKIGREAAEKLLKALAAKMIPIAGWALFAFEFLFLIWIWWEVLVDP